MRLVWIARTGFLGLQRGVDGGPGALFGWRTFARSCISCDHAKTQRRKDDDKSPDVPHPPGSDVDDQTAVCTLIVRSGSFLPAQRPALVSRG